jgi:ribosome-associated toxin RatA of RatAB toxin-antitoxin module
VRTIDRIAIAAPPDRVFAIAADVERWPAMLPHYRWVRAVERAPNRAVIEMAAWRPFGPLRWPTWWVSEMEADATTRRIHYRHIRGITRGMDVEWRVREQAAAVTVEIIHEWDGPAWPLIGPKAAEWVIGPVFIHAIASRTLAGVKRAAERAAAEEVSGGRENVRTEKREDGR